MIDIDSLKAAALAAGGHDWQWWDSCSFRRLTFKEGQHTRDGSALSAVVQQSDGHPDVHMAPGVREFIELASPANVLALIAEKDAEVARLRNPWVSVKDSLPAPGVPALVFTPPQPGDYPGDVRVEFDFIDPDSDEPCWHNHNEHYEHYCCVAKGGDDVSWTGPSEEAPYTHWMAIPVLPRTALLEQSHD